MILPLVHGFANAYQNLGSCPLCHLMYNFEPGRLRRPPHLLGHSQITIHSLLERLNQLICALAMKGDDTGSAPNTTSSAVKRRPMACQSLRRPTNWPGLQQSSGATVSSVSDKCGC